MDDMLPGILTERGAEAMGVAPGPVQFDRLLYEKRGSYYLADNIWRDGEKIGCHLRIGPIGILLLDTEIPWKPRKIAVRTLGMVIDFTDEDTRQLHRDLCEIYDTNDRLVDLLQKVGVGRTDIPWKTSLRDTWQATLIDLHNRMKIGALLTLVSW